MRPASRLLDHAPATEPALAHGARLGLCAARVVTPRRACASGRVGQHDRRPRADSAAFCARDRSDEYARRRRQAGARIEARRLGKCDGQPAGDPDGADDATGADRGVFDPRRGRVEDRPQGPGQRRAPRRGQGRPQASDRGRLRVRRRADRRDVAPHHPDTISPLFRQGQFAGTQRRRRSRHRGDYERRAATGDEVEADAAPRQRDSISKCC